jgi:hypothetical protein
MNQEVLEIEYEVDYRQFRKVWVGLFKESLPNFIAFWGAATVLSVVLFFLLSDKLFGFLLLLIFTLLPLVMIFFGYQNFMKTARQNFSVLSAGEKIVRLTFTNGADGFDSRNGKSFSHTAWESIKGVTEMDDCFVFNRLGSVFYVPKAAFRDSTEIGFLRYLISTNVEKNVKLLE